MRLLLTVLLLLACVFCVPACNGNSSVDAPSTLPTPSGTPASANATIDKVRAVVAKQLSIELSEVTPESSLNDLGCDELDYVEIIMELEESFNITISEDDEAEIFGNAWALRASVRKLADLVDAVRSRQELSE